MKNSKELKSIVLNMNNYNERIKLLASETDLAMDDDDVDQYIIDSTANKKVDDSVELLFNMMKKSIEDEVRHIFTPRFTFENVNESGIMICGKEENIAVGKSTLYEIFSTFHQNYPSDEFTKSTYLAGRKCALHFSDDFRKILSINGKMKIPYSEEKFMNLYSKFDQRSAWWDQPIEYEPGGTVNEPYISATIKKPFTTYPWLKKGFQKDNKFLEGYLQTLFNCCSDILRVIGEERNRRNTDRKIALKVEPTDEPDQEKEFIQIYYTNSYCEEWLEIDKIIYWVIVRLISTNDKDDIVELLAAMEDLKTLLLKDIFSVDTLDNINFIEILDSVRSNLRDVKAGVFKINSLINDIRILYEDYRINFLKENFK